MSHVETRRKFTREFKVAAVKRLRSGSSVTRIARELEVNPNQLRLWKRQFEDRPNSAFSGEGRRRAEETSVAELERKVGQQAMEVDFLKGCLRQIEDLRRSQAGQSIRSLPEDPQRTAKGQRVDDRPDDEPSGRGRATYYRFGPEAVPAVQHVELRDRIQRIALQFPAYGRPRITAELKRQGWEVNHKRVGRILREDNLLRLRERKFYLTTDSRHSFRIYPNLTRDFVPITSNQLWVADITYIRLQEEFVYLAVVLDAYSRLVIGWAIERTLEAKLSLDALQVALQRPGSPSGLIHHSDRGVQYACREYTQLLASRGFQISMSRKGNPYDNAKAESFMKTLKSEECIELSTAISPKREAQSGPFSNAPTTANASIPPWATGHRRSLTA